jgi:hypothetical protein
MPDVVVMHHIATGGHPERPTREECDGSPISDALWAFLIRCWNRDPQLRPTAGDVVEHFDLRRLVRAVSNATSLKSVGSSWSTGATENTVGRSGSS